MSADTSRESMAERNLNFRELPEEIARQKKLFLENPSVAIFEDMPLLVFVLNSSRQIVWENKKVVEMLGGASGIGLRPGEAFGCIHSSENPVGCGGASLCRFCGAPKAFLEALRKEEDIEEWVIQRGERFRYEAFDLLVWSKSLLVQGEQFVILTAQDESQKKRHEMMERIFYHDIGNTINGIRSIISLMDIQDEDPHKDYLDLVDAATEQLVEEIQSHKALQEAEAGELSPQLSLVRISALVDDIIKLFSYSLYGKDISVLKEEISGELSIRTDPVLLRRIVINMIKNALEASGRGEIVRIGFEPEPEGIGIWVWNAAILSAESRLRIFQRSYTTKGRGRGYGTYSMKMLCERYLGGRISFSSDAGEGTKFTIAIPDLGRTGKEYPR